MKPRVRLASLVCVSLRSTEEGLPGKGLGRGVRGGGIRASGWRGVGG